MKKIVKFNKVVGKLSPELAQDLRDELKAHNIEEDKAEVLRKDWAIEEKAALEEGSRTAIKYVSTRTVDQVGDVIIPKGVMLKQYKKNGMPVFWNHNYSLPPIGSDEWVKADDWGIKAKTKYGDTGEGTLANIIWNLVQQGHQKQSSVGIIPLETITPNDEQWKEAVKTLAKEWPEFSKSKKNCSRIITKSLLFEHSDVSLACNTDTEVIAVSKAFIDAGADDKLLKQLGLPLLNAIGDIDDDDEGWERFEYERSKNKDREEGTETTVKDANTNAEGFECNPEEDNMQIHINQEVFDEAMKIAMDNVLKDTKSPACRQKDESKADCVKRKIPEIIAEGYEQDQAVAMANSMCEKGCDEKAAELRDAVEKAYNCECIKCGYTETSEKHCKYLKCPKCGGQMRRAERPGPGQEGKQKRVTLVKEPYHVKMVAPPPMDLSVVKQAVRDEIRRRLGRLT